MGEPASGLSAATRKASASIDQADLLKAIAAGGGATLSEIVTALSGKTIAFSGPVLEDRSIVLDAGDDYTHASRTLEWTIAGWDGPNADGVNGELRFLALNTYKKFGDQSPATMTCGLVITQVGDTLTIKAMPTSAQTPLLWPATHEDGKALYQAKAIIPAAAWDEEMEWSLFRVLATVHRKI